eukprot:364496-Chlamydomonas_euryale.AAC.62
MDEHEYMQGEEPKDIVELMTRYPMVMLALTPVATLTATPQVHRSAMRQQQATPPCALVHVVCSRWAA